jgi:hypothetical protein
VKPFRYLLDPLCALACLLYILNRWLLIPKVGGTFLRGHFNDLLLIPAALPPVLFLHRRLRLRSHDHPPLWSEVTWHLVVWSLLFEGVGPRLMTVTGDPWDVLAYAAGGILAALWWNRNASAISAHA